MYTNLENGVKLEAPCVKGRTCSSHVKGRGPFQLLPFCDMCSSGEGMRMVTWMVTTCQSFALEWVVSSAWRDCSVV